ncbi:hypothetical protein [Neptunicoccus cionae]|uniref:hypothetical protein n=1 Tax=Neptunicoccus cionae TaxID=2035344 RepID=UPI000C76128A|nr:hypothetical protein [Amylibacter cionae]PLS22153.1 hypothetical protein C0U40_06875 [Amylibacter cionae]
MSDQKQTEPASPHVARDGTGQMSHNRADDVAGYPALGRMFTALADPKMAKTLFYTLVVLCAVLFLADFFYHKHTYVSVENIPGFYALYGILMTAGAVLLAKFCGGWVRRPETYYAPNDVDGESYPQDEQDEERHNG